MTDWPKHWSTVLERVPASDLLGQVAKTVGGRPITADQLSALVADIIHHLGLSASDRLLDLCCGNGLVTSLCATKCDQTIGVDFSAPLIDVVAPRFAGPRLRFMQANVLQLPDEVLGFSANKVVMYEALQFFSFSQAQDILKTISGSSLRSAVILFGSVPDQDRLFSFYNTPERVEDYRRRMASNTEAIGHWWSKSELGELAHSANYQVEIFPQNPLLHTAHYRFDVLLHPAA